MTTEEEEQRSLMESLKTPEAATTLFLVVISLETP